MKMFVKNRVFACLAVLLCALLLCSCDSSLNESEDTGFVSFAYAGEEGTSREIAVEERLQYPVESVYWAYTAVKVDGLHTVGESVKDASKAGMDVIKNGQYDDNGYALRPVKNGPACGLGVCSNKFSYGEWVFKLYGYKSYDGANRKFKDLIYTGATVEVEVSVNSSTPQEVNFKLERTEDYPTDGMLAFGTLYYSVPQDMVFYANSAVKVTFIEGADNIVAEGVGYTGSADAAAGTKIWLGVDLKSTVDHKGKNGFFTKGSYDFTVKVEYYSDSTNVSGTADETITVSSPRKFPVVFYAGITTVLSGNVDDVVINDGTSDDTDVDAYVARIRKRSAPSGVTPEANPEWYGWFRTLEEACAAWGTGEYADGSGSNAVILVRDVDYGGVVEVDATQGGGAHLWLSLNEHSLRNLTVVGSNYINIASARNDSSINKLRLGFSNGTLRSISDCDSSVADVVNVYMNTDGGDVRIDYTGCNVYHSGSCENVTVVGNVINDRRNNLGYHVLCDVKELLSIGTSSTSVKGYVELGPHVNINKIQGFASAVGDVVVVGHASTVVGNINNIRDKKSIDGSTAMTAKEQNVWKRSSVTLYRNGGSGGTDGLLLYGIEGMPVNINTYAVYTKTNSILVGFSKFHYAGAPEYKGKNPVIIAIEGNLNLYAVYAIATGGKIFYINYGSVAPVGYSDGSISVDGRVFTFYKADGSSVGNLSHITGRGNYHASGSTTAISLDAPYYTVSGVKKGSKDNFYVYNENMRAYMNPFYVCRDSSMSAWPGADTSSVASTSGSTGGTGSGSGIGNGKNSTQKIYENFKTSTTFWQTNPGVWLNVWGQWKLMRDGTEYTAYNCGYTDWYIPNSAETYALVMTSDLRTYAPTVSSASYLITSTEYSDDKTCCVCCHYSDKKFYPIKKYAQTGGSVNTCTLFIRSF